MEVYPSNVPNSMSRIQSSSWRSDSQHDLSFGWNEQMLFITIPLLKIEQKKLRETLSLNGRGAAATGKQFELVRVTQAGNSLLLLYCVRWSQISLYVKSYHDGGTRWIGEIIQGTALNDWSCFFDWVIRHAKKSVFIVLLTGNGGTGNGNRCNWFIIVISFHVS